MCGTLLWAECRVVGVVVIGRQGLSAGFLCEINQMGAARFVTT